MTTLATAADIALPARDGFPLAATLFLPAEAAPERVVLLSPATGVRRRLYGPFAEFLSDAGLATLTWDWRGVGESRPERLRDCRATMRDWADLDLAGVVGWARERFPAARLYVVGHSYGGQAVGLIPEAGDLSGLVLVGAQSGYWGHWPRPARYAYPLLWYGLIPVLSHLLGYFPSSRFGLGEDLPKGVALEWARWCRSPEYLGDYSGHRAFRAPILALSFTDDAYAPRPAVEALLAEYGSESIEHLHVAPRESGAERIGHFGLFRSGVAPDLWRRIADWLREH